MIILLQKTGLFYDKKDLLRIQNVLESNFKIKISLSECLDFWYWRSELYDASFLSVISDDEVIKFFKEYINVHFDLDLFHEGQIDYENE